MSSSRPAVRTGLILCVAISQCCVPHIEKDPVLTTIEAEFDPSAEPSPRIPSPTDLVYDVEESRLDMDLEPDASAAQQDLVAFLESLDGWPASMPGKASFLGEVDPATVTAETVRVLDITDLAYPEWVDGITLELELFEEGEQTLLVYPGHLPTWDVGSRYAIVVLGGDTGVRGLDQQTVVCSPTFWFFRASEPLVTCEDQDALAGCESTTGLLDDEDAADLEEVRRDTEEVFDALDAMGVDRLQVALAWSFRTSSHTVVPFDPSIDDVHFPNDYYLSEDESHVELPDPEGSTPASEALLDRLELKDGFSLTAPGWMRFVGPLKPGSTNLTSTSLLFVNADDDDDYPLLERRWDETRNEVLLIPYKGLHDHTRYAAVALDYLTDVDGDEIIGSHVWSILKSQNPATDAGGHSLLDGVDDETAQDLEEARLDYEDLFAELEEISYPRRMVQLGQVFTTQSFLGEMQALRERPREEGVSTTAVSAAGVQDPDLVVPAGRPHDSISGVVNGTIRLLSVLDPATREVSADPGNQVEVPFVLTLPLVPPAGRSAAPVVLFVHDMHGSRMDIFAVADALASKGWATLAVDLPGHGGRATCLTDDDCTSGTCEAGVCSSGDVRSDVAGVPVNARDVLMPARNPFAAGDAMRQAAVDLVCVTRSLRAADGPASVPGVDIDTTDVSMFGLGFGAMAGAIFMAVDPAVHVAVLTGPGGNLGRLVSTSAAFDGEMDAWLEDDLGLEPGSEAHHLMRYAWSWAADPGDPGVFAHHLITSPLPDPEGGPDMAPRSLMVQVPMIDQTIPEPSMRFFWLSCGRDLYPVFFESSENSFILDPDDATGMEALAQAVEFIATGGETVLPVGG